MKILRKNNGRNHWYIDEDAGGERVPGVTTLTSDGLPKPALLNWAGDATAEYAVDNWATLDALPLSERLKKIKGGRYEKRDAASNKGTQVHKMAERLIAGERVTVPDALTGYVDSCVRFLDEFDVRDVHVEAVVYSETRRHVGTLDLIADVLLPLGRPRPTLHPCPERAPASPSPSGSTSSPYSASGASPTGTSVSLASRRSSGGRSPAPTN